MALLKEMELENGVRVSYHRVVSVRCTTNVQNTVEVASYPSRERREAEIAGGDSYVRTTWHVLPYEQGMSVDDAYAYLKALPEYEGAADALEPHARGGA